MEHESVEISPIPTSVGIGLRSEHYHDIIAQQPNLGWFEVHTENYFGLGGAPHHYLKKISKNYPISFHGVGLSLGSTDPLDINHIKTHSSTHTTIPTWISL